MFFTVLKILLSCLLILRLWSETRIFIKLEHHVCIHQTYIECDWVLKQSPFCFVVANKSTIKYSLSPYLSINERKVVSLNASIKLRWLIWSHSGQETLEKLQCVIVGTRACLAASHTRDDRSPRYRVPGKVRITF